MWAGAAGYGRDEVAEDLRVFGAPEDVVAQAEAAPAAFPVHPDNWPAVETFLALSTQWRHAGAPGIPTGLDYAAIEPTLRLIGHEPTPGLFAGLRLMEAEALNVFAAKRDR